MTENWPLKIHASENTNLNEETKILTLMLVIPLYTIFWRNLAHSAKDIFKFKIMVQELDRNINQYRTENKKQDKMIFGVDLLKTSL